MSFHLNTEKMLKKRALSSILDLLIGGIIIYLIASYLVFIISWMHPLFYICAWGIYLFFSDLVGGRTIGKSICKLNVVSKKETKSSFIQLLFRDIILKYGFFTFIPFIILFYGIGLDKFLCLLIVFSFQILTNGIYLLIKNELIWDTFSQTSIITSVYLKSSNEPKFFKKVCAMIVDLSIIIIISTISYLGYMKFEYISYYIVFLIIAILYSTITTIVFKTTIGNILFGIKFLFPKEKNQYLIILIREFVKWFPAIIGFIILYVLHYENSLFNIIFILLLYFTSHLISKLATGKPWWNLISGINKINSEVPIRSKIIYSISIFLFFIFSYIIASNLNNNYPSKVKFSGFNFYTYNVHYPQNQNVRNKIAFIKNINTTPKDYIFQLFKKNDIVVLCERYHPEMTQWDFIYDVVSDPWFIKNVGHVFTEYGASNYQDTVDKYFTTHFQNDTLLEMATTDLLRHEGQTMFWVNYNIFNYFKKINQLNNQLPDSLKIRQYFTDVDKYDKNIKNNNDFLKISDIHRDSCIAFTIKKKFEAIQRDSLRKKCLIILNYRHAFNNTTTYVKKKSYVYYKNATSYLFHYFPNQTANVLINTLSPGENGISLLSFYLNIQNGSWDKSFYLNNNKPIGFDFKDSPFGVDKFDMILNSGKRTKSTYQDIFTGMVFINPLDSFWSKTGTLPYLTYNFKEEYSRRISIMGENGDKINQIFDKINNWVTYSYHLNQSTKRLFIQNFPISCFILFFYIGLLFVIIVFFYSIFQKLKH